MIRRILSTMSIAFLGGLMAIGIEVVGQTQRNNLNGVWYQFPSADGGSGTFLRTDGAGNLTWATPPTPEGLWSGSVELSTVPCAAGWTELAAAANKVIRVSTTAGSTGGSDTHSHDVTGVTGSNSVTITGSTAAATATHAHTYSGSGTTGAPSGTTTANDGSGSFPIPNTSHTHGFSWSGTTVSGGASHTHGDGTLAGSPHGHGDGTLAAASASNLPAYYTLRLCQKD